MCKGSTKLLIMEQNKLGDFFKSSVLLELAAADDVSQFQSEVKTNNMGINEVGLWYGRNINIGCKTKMGFQERTPFMVAALYGSINILKYIITSHVDVIVNKGSDSDGATALHCAVAGGSGSLMETVKLLLLAGADPNLTDFNGCKPVDLIARGVKSSVRKCLVMLLNGLSIDGEELEEAEIVSAKKEYPIDASLPDINEGVYGTDEFRMYVFKVKPCSRAYSHDWTECPFVHPGENARRRDPRKHQYSCVPCLEFRKGSCGKGDNCEYAHGVFESWLHPAQYRTRLCKDETGCARKVCFFAHKVEELRPVYASTGSAVPSPKAGSAGLVETGSMSPLLGSTPPMSPSVNGNLWPNKFVHVTPPALQLPGSRLKTSLNARDLNIELEMLQRQQMIDDLSSNVYNNNMFGDMKPTNFDDVYGSPSRQQIRLDSSPLRSAYPSSPGRKPTSFGFDSSSAVAQAVMNTRSNSFAKQRSLSFIDRGLGPTMSPRSIAQPSGYSEWGSPDGKVDWGFKSEDANKFRKSASFGYKSGNPGSPMKASHEPDDPWAGAGVYGSSEKVPQWVEQMYIEQEKLIA